MSVDLKNMMDRIKANENGGVETPERITGIPTEN